MAALLAIFLIVFVALPILVIWRAFALTYLWSWFITPLGLPELSLWHAAGISMIIAYLTYEGVNEDDATAGIVKGLLMPAFALFFGWIIHGLM